MTKPWTAYERFFYRAVRSLDDASRLLLVRVAAPLVKEHATGMVIDLAIESPFSPKAPTGCPARITRPT